MGLRGGSYQGLQRQESRTPPSAQRPFHWEKRKGPGLWAVQTVCNALEPASQMQLYYSPPNHSERSLNQSQRSGSPGQVLPETSMYLLCQWHFMLPSPLPAFPGMRGTHSTSWSCSRGRDKPLGGCRREGPTSMPGHYSKQKASPGRLCSNQAAVNETIYCAPINVQPQDPRMPAPLYCQC